MLDIGEGQRAVTGLDQGDAAIDHAAISRRVRYCALPTVRVAVAAAAVDDLPVGPATGEAGAVRLRPLMSKMPAAAPHAVDRQVAIAGQDRQGGLKGGQTAEFQGAVVDRGIAIPSSAPH